ncbi:hypothetical protein [Aestuariivirga litoralis]|uniref:hypothetical protein n=1 Tax=Aestuariivirga litoralis TaxID=2650924 RepID=UPI0018C6B08B|nr:hypothetical protein [Aestuariivirga litoralis]MBG1232961.1 hypothetical protein [Aestuariivirga litoralis]
MAIRFEPEITTGNILSIGTVIVMMTLAYATLNSKVDLQSERISNLETRVGTVESTIRDAQKANADRREILASTLSGINTRLETLTKSVDDLNASVRRLSSHQGSSP